MQRLSDAQDRLERPFDGPASGRSSGADHALAPPGGLTEWKTLPKPSKPTHSDVEGQETPSTRLSESTLAKVHALAGPVGFEEVTTPLSADATQRLVDGHDTPLS